jgi:hypothetical protein
MFRSVSPRYFETLRLPVVRVDPLAALRHD